MRERKGLKEIPEIWSIVVQEIPGARLIIAGAMSSASETTLRQALSERGVERQVSLLGPIPYDDVPRLLADSRLYVAPSVMEGWGTAVYEALAAGLPVVAFDLPAYTRLGEVIQRVPSGDCRAFAEQVVLRLKAGDDGRQEVRREVAARNDWGMIAEQEIALVREISRRGSERNQVKGHR